MTKPAPVSDTERDGLRRAIELAGRGAGTVLPNPVVGCVLLSPTGGVVGEGFHRRAGGPHAEVAALAAAGHRARGATALVTLEPCDHTGRTGPCSRALIEAGVARVVVAVRDPWQVASGGIERLRGAGVDVVDLTPEKSAGAESLSYDAPLRDIVDAAEDVNRVWLGAVRAQRPFVTLKTAMSVDGRVAAPDGTSKWISSKASRADAHRLRGEVDTIAIGVGTVLTDDPSLTARDADGVARGRQPLRVVFDSRGRTPADAQVRDTAAPTVIATAADFGAGADGHVDAGAVLAELYARGRRHLLLEGGPRLAAAFLDAGLVHELMVYLAPLVLGAGRSAVEGGRLRTLAEAQRLEWKETRQLGPDLLVRYRVSPRAGEHSRGDR